MSSLAAAPDHQLARIKLEIERCGSATISGDELDVLCPDETSIAEQFLRIAEIARSENWDVDFGGDAIVRVVSPIEAMWLAI